MKDQATVASMAMSSATTIHENKVNRRFWCSRGGLSPTSSGRSEFLDSWTSRRAPSSCPVMYPPARSTSIMEHLRGLCHRFDLGITSTRQTRNRPRPPPELHRCAELIRDPDQISTLEAAGVGSLWAAGDGLRITARPRSGDGSRAGPDVPPEGGDGLVVVPPVTSPLWSGLAPSSVRPGISPPSRTGSVRGATGVLKCCLRQCEGVLNSDSQVRLPTVLQTVTAQVGL